VRDAGSTAKELMQEAEKNDQNVSRLDDASVSELQNGNLPANVSGCTVLDFGVPSSKFDVWFVQFQVNF
jgi:hypothetical protein